MGQPPLIVFSDLDGTLLDHDSYSFAPARPALRRLAALGIPLILASSKTASEIEALQAEIGCGGGPAIVENGAGILSPEGGFGTGRAPWPAEGYKIVEGKGDRSDIAAEPLRTTARLSSARYDPAAYPQLLAAINETSPYLRALFQGFSDLGPDGISRATGLAPGAARLAAQRQYSEPGLWHGGPNELAEFLRSLKRLGVTARRGGRFLTLSFGGTKADQMDRIATGYGNPPRLALGDAPNDAEMLEAADYGVVIANPHGAPLPRMPGEAAGLIRRTALEGPLGWNSAVLDLLYQLNL